MHRLLIQYGKTYNHLIKSAPISNDIVRLISSSFVCSKEIQLTDEVKDVPFYFEDERTRKLSPLRLKNYLKKTLQCPSELAEEIWFNCPEFREKSLIEIDRNVGLLTLKGLSKSSIVDNPSLLTLNYDSLSFRLRILESMEPENIDDMAPLANFSDDRIIKIKEIAETEKNAIPSKHRIYHFSKLLSMEPYTISKHASIRPYMLEMPFEDVDDRIKLMLKYRTPTEIVKRLSLIQRSPNIIEFDLTKTKNEMNELLAGRSIAQYYADRLNCEIETIEDMLKLYPILATCNTLLIDKKIGYLLEVGLKGSDIVRYPSALLFMTLDRMKKRIPELQLYGCHNTRILGMAYQASKSYNDYVVRLKKQQEKQNVNQK